MLVSMLIPVEMACWVWVVEDGLGSFRRSCFLSVCEDFDLAVLRLEKPPEKIDTESWLDPESMLEFWSESEF